MKIIGLALLLGGADAALRVAGAVGDYNEAQACEDFDLAQAAYCPDATVEFWNCSTCSNRVTPTGIVEEETSGGRAIVGYDERDDTVFVSFRGSENLENWIENFKFVMTYPYENNASIGVAGGFYEWYSKLRDVGVADLVRDSLALSVSKSVKVIGHSAGGAVSVLLAYDIMRGSDFYPKGTTLSSLTTFGSPRTGNADFAASFGSFLLKTTKSARITHNRDMVPQLPPEAFYYHHIAQEIFYNEDSTEYTVCDNTGEDPVCSDSCFCSLICDNIPDHLLYMNKTVGIAGC